MISKWVGESERGIREIFKKAKQSSPSIIFLDEFESIASMRSASNGEGSDVGNRVVNQLLASMDGVESLDGVIVVAATNRPEMIDPALLRSGRFECVLHVPPPDHGARVPPPRRSGGSSALLCHIRSQRSTPSASSCCILARKSFCIPPPSLEVWI